MKKKITDVKIKAILNIFINGFATSINGRTGCFVLMLIGCATWQPCIAEAIEIYHFLVEFKNGSVVERIFSEPPERYEDSFKEYIMRTKLIEKRHYSVDGFIRTFGEKNYKRLVTGYFGFGPEEDIILKRQTHGLEADANALPAPDKMSAKLLETWKFIEKKDNTPAEAEIHLKSKRPDRFGEETVASKPSPVPRASDKKTTKASSRAEKKTVLKPPEKSIALTGASSGKKIVVYRFLVEYINGKIMERHATVTLNQYQNLYRGYVKRAALIEKKAYTENHFKSRFGQNAHQLLVQGSFGIGDIEMIMESRIKRGLPPRNDVLPKPGPETPKLTEKLEQLLSKRNFTLRNKP